MKLINMDVDKVLENLSTEDSEFSKECSLITENVISGSLPIVTLIEKLDFLLTSASPDERELGVKIFAEVLEKVPTDLLNAQQVELISTFFINKFKDHHKLIPPTIKGLVSIVQLKYFPVEHIPIMLTTMVDNISCQQQQQADRYNIYRLFELLLGNFSKELIFMGVNFTYIIISSIDGERDPRNLMFLFKLMNKYLKIIPLGHLVEDMFDVLACYFPVDFKTPSNNAAVTREDLSQALCPCLCAVAEFGQPCIDLALEKLDSSLKIAKVDSLELLKIGCDTFKPETYLENGYKIWSQIHKDVFTSTIPLYQQQCLVTLTRVVNRMSQGDEDQFKNFLCDILDTLKGNLLPESKQYKQSLDLLLSISRGSQISSAIISSNIVPILINTFSIAPIQFKPTILRALVSFIQSYMEQNNNPEQKEEMETIVSLCFKSIPDVNEDLRKEVFRSFGILAPYISEDTRRILYKAISSYIVAPDTFSVREEFNQSLIELSKHYRRDIEEIISQVTISEPLSLDLYLTTLCSLAPVDDLREFISNAFIKCIGENCHLACTAIINLRKLLKAQENNHVYLTVFTEKNLIGILIEFCVNHITETKVKETMTDVCSVIKIMIGSLDSSTQKLILSHHLKQISDNFEKEEIFVILLSGLLLRLNRDLEIDWALINKLADIAVKRIDARNKEVSVQLLSNMVNKKNVDDNFKENLELLKSKCERSNEYITMSWLTKALVTRNHPEGINWLSLLLNNLDNNAQLAEGFKILLDSNYDCLSPRSNCIVMPLYQQKVFIYTINKISSVTTKPQYLKTFGYILQFAPQEVLLVQFSKISKMILLTLENSEDGETLLNILQTIKKIIANNKTEIIEHLEDYVTRILKLTQFQGSMKVRIEAVQFIHSLLSIAPIYKLLQLKKSVLEVLGHCVDDKKRLVRKEAMEARALWFFLDVPLD